MAGRVETIAMRAGYVAWLMFFPFLPQASDPVRPVVDRLDLAHPRLIKGLTPFGDRMEGTPCNRVAIDWLEKQLKSFVDRDPHGIRIRRVGALAGLNLPGSLMATLYPIPYSSVD